MKDAILHLLELWQPYKPESPCWWTWGRLHKMTDVIWQDERRPAA